jgi:cytoskeletal protein CcmA (bactofilin family)
VELQASAFVKGDIYTPRISVLEGGRVSGEVNMSSEPLAAAVSGVEAQER